MHKFVFPLILMVGVAVGAASCGDNKISPAETVLLGCDTFASTLSVVADLNTEGKLNANTVKIVDQTRNTVNPICEGRAPDVNSTVKDVAIDAGTRTLLSIAAQFGRN